MDVEDQLEDLTVKIFFEFLTVLIVGSLILNVIRFDLFLLLIILFPNFRDHSNQGHYLLVFEHLLPHKPPFVYC